VSKALDAYARYESMWHVEFSREQGKGGVLAINVASPPPRHLGIRPWLHQHHHTRQIPCHQAECFTFPRPPLRGAPTVGTGPTQEHAGLGAHGRPSSRCAVITPRICMHMACAERWPASGPPLRPHG
jgi:hypothetical protein